nr:MAG TPA: hypothetical protein [Bacteriophage sp.]
MQILISYFLLIFYLSFLLSIIKHHRELRIIKTMHSNLFMCFFAYFKSTFNTCISIII